MTPESLEGERRSSTQQPAPRLTSIAERDRSARRGLLDDPDLPAKVVDRIDSAVDVFRTRIAEPIERAATAIVLSVLTVIIGIAAVTMIVIGLFRLVSELFSPYEWIAHAVFGVLFVVLGVSVFWRKAFRNP